MSDKQPERVASMLSAQINELRELSGDGSMEWLSGPVRAIVLRDAADTIWQLRDDLQRANNAVQDAEHDESMAWDRVRKAEAENARLRERVAELEELLPDSVRWYRAETVEAYVAEIAKLRGLLTFYLGCLTNGHVNCDSCAFAENVCEHGRMVIDWARELGIEVPNEP